jgi:hypothetical protein
MARVADLSGNSPVGLLIEPAVGQNYDLQTVRPQNEQVAAYTGTPGNSTVFDNTYQTVRIQATTLCHYKVGPAAVAAVTDNPLSAGVFEYVKVRPGDRISVIQSAAGGNLHIAKVL